MPFAFWPLAFGLFFAVCGVSCPPWHRKLARGLFLAALACGLSSAAVFAVEAAWR